MNDDSIDGGICEADKVGEGKRGWFGYVGITDETDETKFEKGGLIIAGDGIGVRVYVVE